LALRFQSRWMSSTLSSVGCTASTMGRGQQIFAPLWWPIAAFEVLDMGFPPRWRSPRQWHSRPRRHPRCGFGKAPRHHRAFVAHPGARWCSPAHGWQRDGRYCGLKVHPLRLLLVRCGP
jgi:hypothetical protein